MSASLFVSAITTAVPISKAEQIKLAMLDLEGLGLLDEPNQQPSQQLNKKDTRKKQIKKEKLSMVYPRDCMTWSKKMILQKSKDFDVIIHKNAREYKVDSNLIRSVITAESCFRKKALSKANAKGLMQLIPDTAKRFGVKNSYEPKQNIRGGTKYLRFLLDRFKGNLTKVIAAYNAGEGKVDIYKGVPPYKETRQYVKNVLKVYSLLKPKVLSQSRVKAVYKVPRLGLKPGRNGWAYNRKMAPHLYKH